MWNSLPPSAMFLTMLIAVGDESW